MAVAPQAEAQENAGQEPVSNRPIARGPVLLQDRFQIDPDKPRPDLDSPSATAFTVNDRLETGRALTAMICTPGLPPRNRTMAALKGSAIRGSMTLVEYGSVDWPPLGQRCMAVIYETPLGGRFVDSPSSAGKKISEQEMLRRLIRPVYAALKQFESRELTHRSIRPNNLYFTDKDQQLIVLGECVSAPAAFDQPIVFETIERSMASQGGRGSGSVSDDLYALGVTVLFTLLGRNPVADMSDFDLIASKMNRGTYATLCTDQPVPLSLLEPLRGLLADSESERWDMNELNSWCEGRRQTPPQRRPIAKLEEPIEFMGHEHFNKRVLAVEMMQNRTEAAALIREGELEQWLRRSTTEQELAETVKVAVESVVLQENDGPPANDFLVAKIAILLDPAAPIRYKDFAFMPDAIGAAIAVETLRRGDVEVVREAILQQIPKIWFAAQDDDFKPRNSAVEEGYAEIDAFLSNDKIGFGIERCLYELNSSLPCQSPLLIHDYVVSIQDLLPTFDQISKRIDSKTKPMDRHIAAFIVARTSYDLAPHLAMLADPDERKAAVGMLSLLAMLQQRLETGPLFGLTSWVGGLLGPAINTYHSRSTRQILEREIPRLVRRGSLPDLFALIDNADRRRTDIESYTIAEAQYAAAEAEIKEIDSETEKSETIVQLGQQWASVSAIIAAMMIIMIMILYKTV